MRCRMRKEILSRPGAVFGAGLCALASGAAAQTSPAWLDYASNPDAHPTIPNVAYAGYGSGTVPVPTPGDGRTIVPVSNYGAFPDDGIDDTDAIRLAVSVAGPVADANPNGAAVMFDPGEYELSGPVFVHDDGVMIAGAGRDQTVLRFTSSLNDSHAEYTNWGFSGGLMWFVDAARETYRVGVPSINSLDLGWSTSSPASDLVGGATLGDRSIEVDDASAFGPGDYVFLQVDNDDDLSTLRHLLGDGAWANGYPFSPMADAKILPSNRSVVRSMHRIESISGDTITFEEPLKFDARQEWNPTVRSPSRTLRDVGIRDLTLRMDRPYVWTISDHNDEPGFNGVCMTAVINGYIENVSFRNTDGGAVIINGGKHVTVRDVDIGADSEDLRAMHHAFFLANSFDVLVQDFQIDAVPLHGLYYGSFTMGSVYSRGTAAGGAFDYHRILPYANAMTEIDIVNSGAAGGASDSGPRMGARHAHWNVSTNFTSGRLIAQPDVMPRGSLVGVRCVPVGPSINGVAGDAEPLIEASGPSGAPPSPANLHDAQLALRLSQAVPPGDPFDECDACGADGVYAFDGAMTLGQELSGQDGWVLDRDFSGTGQVASVQLDASYPGAAMVAPIGAQGLDGIYERQNNEAFFFTPPSAGNPAIELEFDLRSGGSSGSGDALLIVNNAYDEGVQFGIINNNTFTIRGGRFSSTLRLLPGIPSGWYTRGEWARLRLTMDLSANAGDGEATLAFMNLSRGDVEYTDVPALTGVSLLGEVRYPETWDRIECRIDDEAAFTNVRINIDPSDDIACCRVDVAEPFGELDFLDAVRFYDLFNAADPEADWNADGAVTDADAEAFVAEFEAGCL